MMEKLKPCPFCGGAAGHGCTQMMHYVKCTKCRAEIPSTSLNMATVAWNEREPISGQGIPQDQSAIAAAMQGLAESMKAIGHIADDGEYRPEFGKICAEMLRLSKAIVPEKGEE